jgi:hypothetical protein
MSESNIKNLIYQEIKIIIDETKDSFKNTKSFAVGEAWKILQLLTATVVQLIEQFGNSLSSPDKKQLALDIISDFYDSIFIRIDIPWVPSVLEPVIHSHIKNFLMIFVSAGIDAMVTTFRNIGVFKNKSQTSVQCTVNTNNVVVLYFIKNIKDLAIVRK